MNLVQGQQHFSECLMRWRKCESWDDNCGTSFYFGTFSISPSNQTLYCRSFYSFLVLTENFSLNDKNFVPTRVRLLERELF